MSKIKRELRFPDRTPEWHEYRKTCIGGSSAAVVLNLNEYLTSAELLHKKCGFINEKNDPNKFTFFGVNLEDVISTKYWQYYDPADPESLYLNAHHGKIIRKCRKMRGFIWDDQNPHLKVSLDVVMAKGSFNILTGEEVEPRTSIEIKTIHPYAFKKYGGSPPASYIIQCQAQMAATGTSYAEIAMLCDRDFFCFPIPGNKDIQNTIIEATKEFMDLVNIGHELKKQYDLYMLNENYKGADDIMHQLDEITPTQQPGQEEIYKQFLDKKYLPSERAQPQVMGTDRHIKLAKQVKVLDEAAKYIKNKSEFFKNEIKRDIGINQNMLFEDSDIRISWRNNSAGNKYFRMHGVDVDKEEIIKKADEFREGL